MECIRTTHEQRRLRGTVDTLVERRRKYSTWFGAGTASLFATVAAVEFACARVFGRRIGCVHTPSRHHSDHLRTKLHTSGDTRPLHSLARSHRYYTVSRSKSKFARSRSKPPRVEHAECQRDFCSFSHANLVNITIQVQPRQDTGPQTHTHDQDGARTARLPLVQRLCARGAAYVTNAHSVVSFSLLISFLSHPLCWCRRAPLCARRRLPRRFPAAD